MTSGLEGVRGLVEEIAHQKPEKPDYWNSCSQCERNIDAAREALAAPPTPPADARGDVRGLVAKWRDEAAAYVAQANEKYRSGGFRWAGWMRDELLSKAGVCKRHADELESALAAEGVQAGEVEVADLIANMAAYLRAEGGKNAAPLIAHADRILTQQPETRGVVDESMVERAYQAWRKAAVAREGNKPAIRAALTAALTEARNVR